MNRDSIKINRPVILLVEGKDEKLLIESLLKYLNIFDKIQIFQTDGKDNLGKRLLALTGQVPGHNTIKSIGIVRDADDNPAGAFQSVCTQLRLANLPIPSNPMEKCGAEIGVTVLIVPNIDQTGMLENICLDSVADDPAILCVDEFFSCLNSRLDTLPKNVAKARVRAFITSRELIEESIFEKIKQNIFDLHKEVDDPITEQTHSFLSSRYKPKLDLGQAAQAGYWNFNHKSFKPLIKLLEMICEVG